MPKGLRVGRVNPLVLKTEGLAQMLAQSWLICASLSLLQA